MKYMQKEMREQFMQDIQSGKIWGLKLVKTQVEAIRSNAYADVYLIPREIVKWDNEKFYVKTRRNIPEYKNYNGIDYVVPHCKEKTEQFELCESYYNAFDYYDGNILRGIDEIPMAVNPEDSVQITEYEIIWSY